MYRVFLQCRLWHNVIKTIYVLTHVISGAAYLRAHDPQYEDGVGTPRKMSRDLKPAPRTSLSLLPDALTVSSKLIWVRNDPHEHLTALAAIWGQFVAHDISYTLPLSGYEKVSHTLHKQVFDNSYFTVCADGESINWILSISDFHFLFQHMGTFWCPYSHKSYLPFHGFKRIPKVESLPV